MRAMDRRGPFLPIGHVNEEEKETTMQCLKHIPAREAHMQIVPGRIVDNVFVYPQANGNVNLMIPSSDQFTKNSIYELGKALLQLSEFM
jgi:hypothetical protein